MFLQHAADTQVLVIARHSNVCEEGLEQPAGSLMPEANSSNQQPEQQEGAAQLQQQQQVNTSVQPAAPASARRTSTSSSPRSRLASRAAAPSQPSASNSPRTPRATGKAKKAPAAAAVTTAGAGRQPEPAAAAKGKSRQSLPTPQGRGLALPQQQALVQRLQQAEGVMELLQQDLQASLAARQQLEEQLQQQLCGTGCAERQQLTADASLQPSVEQGSTTAQKAAEFGANGVESCSEGGSAEATVSGLQQQLQEQVQLTSQARQELAAVNEVVAAQQQQVAELQTQVQQQAGQDQQQQQHMQALQQELAGAQGQLQALQQQTASTPADCLQQGQQGFLPQQQHTSASGAPQEPICCPHEARCQQLQTILQALLQQLPEAQQWHSSMRPHTAAVQRSPRTRPTWQHRPVGLHTLLYPPLAVAAQLQPAAAQGYPRSANVPRCATADRSSPRHWESRAGTVRCNTSGALTATCSSGGAGRFQDGGLVLTDGRLRPLTYRGPDTGTAVAATSARRRLSADAEQGLLASLRVAPVSGRVQRGSLSSARGCAEDSAPGLGGRGPTQQQFSPRRQERADAAAGAQAGYSAGCVSPRRGGGSWSQGSVRRGVPKLALSGLH